MDESLCLFDGVVNSRWFVRTSIILFLNKIDLFKQKLPKAPLEHYYKDYVGGADINKAAKYILFRFVQKNRARLSIYPQCVSLSALLYPLLTHAQLDMCNRYRQRTTSIRCCERNDTAERITGLGDIVTWYKPRPTLLSPSTFAISEERAARPATAH